MINFIFEIIKTHGWFSVVLGGLIEQIVVPIPSPIIPMAAGFLFVSKDIYGFFPIFTNVFLKAALPFAIGSTIGSTFIYLISYFGGKFLIEKFSKLIDIKWEEVEAIKKKYFHGNFRDKVVIFLSRAIPVVPSALFSAVCGAIRFKPFDYYLFTAIGLLVRGLILGFVGYKSGEALFSISKGLDGFEMILSVGFVAICFLLFVFAYIKRKKWLKSLSKQ